MHKNLNFDYLNNTLNKFELSENDSYVNTYQNFIEHFKAIQEITWHDVVIGSHLVYGWMPTIIKLNYSEKDKVVKVLNLAKRGDELSINDLLVLKKTVNNSLVGASKLLHFINPEKYAIWDSRIFRFITEKKSQYGIDKPENYLEYLRGLAEISNNKNYQSFHKKVESKFDYKITAFRAIEIVMFETDRHNQKNKLI
jgi:hypothetical protein